MFEEGFAISFLAMSSELKLKSSFSIQDFLNNIGKMSDNKNLSAQYDI
jgi:hypothetical protein